MSLRIIILLLVLYLIPKGAFTQEEKQSAAQIIEQILQDGSIEKAIEKFDVMLLDTGKYDVSESEFNALGYSMAQQRNFDAAIAVLQMNVKAFPGSWNVYDSMGEIYSWINERDTAVWYFYKSLEINPDNQNALMNLSRISGYDYDLENETKVGFTYKESTSTAIDEEYFGMDPPGLEAKLFAPGLISTAGNFEFACTFSPDGKEFYFTRRKIEGGGNVIMFSRWEEDGWTVPDTAEFSKAGWNNEPYISPDGKRLYFGTSRIKPGEEQPSYGIWMMERLRNGWGEPYFCVDGMYVSTDNKGNMYLNDIYRKWGGGIVMMPVADAKDIDTVRVGGGVNDPVYAAHSCISPDRTYILFDCSRIDGQGGEGDIYVAFKNDDGSWSKGYNLGDTVNTAGTDFCPSISPDGKYIFFSRNKDIYWVSVDVLKKLK
ncbi:hypothetical protein ACFLRY_01110 [Bacteroidota bacterium]